MNGFTGSPAARFSAVEDLRPHARGSVQSRDREGAVSPTSTRSQGRRTSLVTLILTLASLTAAASIAAQDTVLQIDPAQTKVEFTLDSLLHTVHGTFQLKRGDLRFDPATGLASGDLVVDAASGESGSDARDKRMHKDVLESDRYPEIVFRPDRVEGKVAPQGVSHVQLHGVFSIHGADHEIVMPADVEAAAGQYTATAKFAVPYVKWGMKNPSTLFLRVSQEVQIAIHTVATVAK